MSITYDYFKQFLGKRAAVLGFGVSNIPLVRLLTEYGVSVSVRDVSPEAENSREARELSAAGVRFVCGRDYLRDLTEDVIFRSPGIMPHTPEIESAVRRGAVLTSEMEAFFDIAPCAIIGVTGSDGKTTTSTLIANMLSAGGHNVWLGGNIGRPLLPLVSEMRKNDFAVVELSSFQLMTMKKSPAVAVVTNITPNHLDRHKSFEEYIDAKSNILKYQDQEGLAVLNYDDAITRALADRHSGSLMFSLKDLSGMGGYKGFYLEDGKITRGGETFLDTAEIRVPGMFNVANFQAAIAAACAFISKDSILKAAREFTGIPHRIELVRELDGVRYYNHSIASSPGRTIVGLGVFSKKVILIAGGKDKGIPYDELGQPIMKSVRELIVTGATAENIARAVRQAPGYRGDPPIHMIESFEDAVLTAKAIAGPGDIVLLSPASTSFDRFKNFEERGDYFKSIVNNW